jgi:hypothetical protein
MRRKVECLKVVNNNCAERAIGLMATYNQGRKTEARRATSCGKKS